MPITAEELVKKFRRAALTCELQHSAGAMYFQDNFDKIMMTGRLEDHTIVAKLPQEAMEHTGALHAFLEELNADGCKRYTFHFDGTNKIKVLRNNEQDFYSAYGQHFRKADGEFFAHILESQIMQFDTERKRTEWIQQESRKSKTGICVMINNWYSVISYGKNFVPEDFY